jgi:hypothetical protein
MTFSKMDSICINICDTEIGISPDYFEKMFMKLEDIKDNGQMIHNMGLNIAANQTWKTF